MELHVTQASRGIQNISLLFEATSECSESGGRVGARVDDFLLGKIVRKLKNISVFS